MAIEVGGKQKLVPQWGVGFQKVVVSYAMCHFEVKDDREWALDLAM